MKPTKLDITPPPGWEIIHFTNEKGTGCFIFMGIPMIQKTIKDMVKESKNETE